MTLVPDDMSSAGFRSVIQKWKVLASIVQCFKFHKSTTNLGFSVLNYNLNDNGGFICNRHYACGNTHTHTHTQSNSKPVRETISK